MISRLTRIFGSLGAVIVLFWTYRLLAVPFIEPSVNVVRPTNVGDVPRTISRDDDMNALKAWFSEGEWERTSPKILETGQGMLLVNSYQMLGEGRVQIVPCTMIFLPEGDFSAAERQRRAIIMQSPQGAILQFDAFDLKLGKVGKLIAGKLIGAVTIRSDQREPGPQDDLQIITSDVDMTEQRFTTPQPVDFKVGANYGHGRSLQIDMAPQGSKRGFRGMTMLQLFQDVEMHILPGGNDIFPGGHKRAAAASPATPEGKKPGLPVEISCRGPFRFDFMKNVATFKDQVDVKRENPSGPSDQINGQLLSMFFEAAAPHAVPAPPPTAAADSDKTSTNLQPVRLEVDGSPVTVHAHSNGMQARGQHIDYLIKSGAVTIRGEPEAMVEQAGREIHARELTYQPDPSGRIGQFTATGQGWVRGSRAEDKGQPFHAAWNRRLYFRPYEGSYLLSLEGGALVEVIGKGAVGAEEIYLWVRDTSPPPPPGQPASEGRQQFAADRMQAVGHVKIDAVQLTGEVGQLQTWFETITVPREVSPSAAAEAVPVPAAREAVRGPATTTISGPVSPPPWAGPQVPAQSPPAQPVAQAPPPTAALETIAPGVAAGAAAPERLPVVEADAAPLQRFHISGELMQARVKMMGNVTELSEVVVEHNVRLSETQTRAVGEKPLLVMGQKLHMTMPQPKDAIVMVTGEPSYVEARGITMTSETIHLNRGRNILWTDSQGAMTFPLNRDLDGRPVTEVQMLNVSWQGQMQFDGEMARFDRHVIADQGLRKMTTELLEVLLSQRVVFGSASAKDRPEVERINCHSGVLLESRTLEGQRLMSIDKMQAADLTVHQPTGDLAGQGPGWVSSVRFDAQQNGPALPGMAKKPANAVAPKKPSSGLTYLGVDFQRSLTGNIRRHEMHFENQVRAVYGPVATWESRLDPDEPETWGEEGACLTTDRLNVVEVAGGLPDQRTFELEALGGKTSVDNLIYRAQCSRLTYDQSKGLLVLEGDGRRNATLFRQLRLGAAPSEMVARKIFYWPNTNRVNVDEANMLDLTMPPNANQTR